MGLPNHYLPMNVDFNESHNASMCKHELRTEAEVEAYFNDTFGASTAVHNGTAGVNYEYDAEHGYRWITGTGGLVLNLSNICDTLYHTEDFPVDTPEEKYMMQSGFTWEFEVKTDEWIDSNDAVDGTLLNPITDVNGTPVSPSGGYYFMFVQNNTFDTTNVRVYDDIVTKQAKSHNAMRFFTATSIADAGAYQRAISRYKKAAHVKVKFTLQTHMGQAWIDNIPFSPPSGGSNNATPGPNWMWPSSGTGAQRREQTSGNWYLYLGTYKTQTSGVARWIRNFRMFSVPITRIFPPTLRYVASFGDSYSRLRFGAQPAGAGTEDGSPLGTQTHPGDMAAGDFSDITSDLQFVKALNNAGVAAYEMSGGGQGGHFFGTNAQAGTLEAEGYLTQLKRMAPSAIFTFGMYNDITPGTVVADLQTRIFDNYMLPMFRDHGTKLWGWVIPSMPPTTPAQDTAHQDFKIELDNMLLGFPAAWDAAYPDYAGMVKVKDARPYMGGISPTESNRTWDLHYYDPQTDVHPGEYGNAVFGELCAEMALESL